MKEKLETHCSYMTTYRMFKDSERELRFPLAVSVSYHNGDRGKHGEVVRGYVACDLVDRTPKQVERLYHKRSAIETSYRLFLPSTSDNDDTGSTRSVCVRAGEFPVGESLGSAAMGGRDLPTQFASSTFCDWIRHVLEQEVERRWEIGRGLNAQPAASGCPL